MKRPAVGLLLLLAGCAEPEGLALRHWRPLAPSPLARERPIQALSPGQLEWAEALLLRDGYALMGEERIGLDRLPAWDEAAATCAVPPICRLAGNRLMVELGGSLPWLVHLPEAPGVLDVIDDGSEVVVVVLKE